MDETTQGNAIEIGQADGGQGTGETKGNTSSTTGGNRRKSRKNSSTTETQKGSGAETGNGKEEQLLGLAVLTEEEKTIPTPTPTGTSTNKPKPNRNAKKKREQAKKAKEQSATESIQLAAQNISMLLGAVSGIVASRAGAHWVLSPEEIESLANPTARILAKHNIVEKANDYGDYIALTIAAVGITVPRIMIHQSIKRQERVKNAKPMFAESGTGTGAENERSVEKPADRLSPSEVNVAADVPSDVGSYLPALGQF